MQKHVIGWKHVDLHLNCFLYVLWSLSGHIFWKPFGLKTCWMKIIRSTNRLCHTLRTRDGCVQYRRTQSIETEVCSESTSTLCADACSRSIVLKSCCRTKIMQHKKCQRIDEHRTTHSTTQKTCCAWQRCWRWDAHCAFSLTYFFIGTDTTIGSMSLHACGRHKMQICQFANVAPMVSAPLWGAPEINYCFDLPKCQERVPRISSRGALGLHN